MGRHIKERVAVNYSDARNIYNDPFDHAYDAGNAHQAYLRLSAKRGVMPPENMRVVAIEGKILKDEKLQRNISYGKTLYEA